MPEQLLTLKVDQWFPKCPVLLPAHHVEVVGGCGGVADLNIALLDVHDGVIVFDVDCAVVGVDQLEVAFNAARGVFGALAVVAVGQVYYYSRV